MFNGSCFKSTPSAIACAAVLYWLATYFPCLSVDGVSGFTGSWVRIAHRCIWKWVLAEDSAQVLLETGDLGDSKWAYLEVYLGTIDLGCVEAVLESMLEHVKMNHREQASTRLGLGIYIPMTNALWMFVRGFQRSCCRKLGCKGLVIYMRVTIQYGMKSSPAKRDKMTSMKPEYGRNKKWWEMRGD